MPPSAQFPKSFAVCPGWSPDVHYPENFLQEAHLLHWNGPFKPWNYPAVHLDRWEKWFIPDPSGRFSLERPDDDSWGPWLRHQGAGQRVTWHTLTVTGRRSKSTNVTLKQRDTKLTNLKNIRDWTLLCVCETCRIIKLYFKPNISDCFLSLYVFHTASYICHRYP